MAPGRFAAAINQAPMRRHRLAYAGDWLRNRHCVFRSGGLPPAHLLRKTFEEAPDFQQAKAWLSHTPIALPVIYVLAGVEDGEGCVIERTEYDHAIRPIMADRVCAANHFETRLHEVGQGWRARPIDSDGRARTARGVPRQRSTTVSAGSCHRSPMFIPVLSCRPTLGRAHCVRSAPTGFSV